MSRTLLAIGNPLLDITVTFEDAAIFEEYGLNPGDACLAEDKHKPLFERMLADDKVHFTAGGAAQNSIRAAQWMASDEGVTNYVGGVGNDDNGNRLKAALAENGVNEHYLVVDDAPTGCCAVVVHDKERSLCADLGASQNYNIGHFGSEAIQNLVGNVDVFYCTAFVLTHSVDSIEVLGKHVAANNKTFMFNIAAPFLVQFHWDAMAKILPYTDIICCNEVEAAAFAEKNDWDKTNLLDVAQKLRGWEKVGDNPRVVIFTQGSKSTIVCTEEGVKEYAVNKIDPNLIVDTNGAGDSFVGGFLAGLSRNASIEKSVEAGHHCASYCIQKSGADYEGDSGFDWE